MYPFKAIFSPPRLTELAGHSDFSACVLHPHDILLHAADLLLLVVVGRKLLFALLRHLLDIGAVVAGILAHFPLLRVEGQDAGHAVVEKCAVVGDDQRPAVEIGQPGFQPVQHADVEMVGRFVEQQELRIVKQHQGQVKPRFLPAAQPRHGQIALDLVQAQSGQDAFRAPRIGRADAPQQGIIAALQQRIVGPLGQTLGQRQQLRFQHRHAAARPANDLAGGQTAVDFKALRQIAEAQAGVALDMAGIGRFLPGNDAQQSRLAAAVRPDKRGAVAGIDAKCDVFE